MRFHSNQRRARRIISILAVAIMLIGGRGTQAQPQAPAAETTTYLPLVLGSGASAPRAAVRFVPDPAPAAHAAIGPEGGVLSAEAADGTRFDLLIAPEALDF